MGDLIRQTILITLLFLLSTEAKEEKEALVQSESKDGKLDIIKQIKKVNDDGSYTVGYEADDGSFKIESRDVLGNIKGTYGYVDDSGQIKRVSYSTSNTSEIPPKPEAQIIPSSSVVQRIPSKANRTYISSTTRKPFYLTRSSTTTQSTPTLVYATSTPSGILAGRPLVRSTQATLQKGQLVRPDTSTTELPLFRRLALKQSTPKPVTEEPEESRTTNNILRRQLSQESGTQNFNPQQHVYMLQQSVGSDSPDIYGSSVHTPRPLFTTTARSARIKYQDLESTPQESTTENTISDSTSTPVPVVQIPSGLRQPQYDNGPVLIPVPVVPKQDQQPVYLRRVPPPQFRPIPVQVDENGYIRPVQVPPNYPLPVPVPVQPVQPVQQVPQIEYSENEIEKISPPVSTRDFQRLLQQLIVRQTRLERISALTDPRRYPELYQPRYRYYPVPQPQYDEGRARQFQYEDIRARQQQQQQQQQYALQREDNRQYIVAPQEQRQYEQPYPQQNRRVARLLPSEQQSRDEYLPPDVREMLLLRMLQLAINPALPLNEEEAQSASSTVTEYKKVRNVEILGEEPEEKKHELQRTKQPIW